MDSPDIITKAATMASLLSEVKSPTEQLPDRARGVMLGLAVGNLLGLPVESWRYEAIDRRYPQGMADIDPQEVNCPMDDDLAQAVDLGEALVEGGDYINSFADRLVTWRRENGRGIGILTSTVINELEYGHAPPEAARLVYRDNPIAPNGGLMRCAPVALARHRQPELLIKDSAATCVVTHYALTCQWSCIIINVVIAMLLRGAEADLRAIMSAAREDGAPDMLANSSRDGIPTEILSAIESGRPAITDASWLRQEQGLIGHTLLAMQAGLWAAVTPLPFESALRQVVEAGGDTDTNGAVIGAVLGARYGATAIPQRWLDCVPERDRIDQLVQDLTTLAGKKNFDAAFCHRRCKNDPPSPEWN